MDGAAGFPDLQGLPSSNSGMLAPPAAANPNANPNPPRNPNNNGTNGSSSHCTIREQDRFMPIANVIRIMRKVLPSHAKISDDAKETIQECVSEYISFITSEANERCQKEQRKTITAEDVLWAMSKLGFDDYIEPLSIYLQRYRELEGDHRGSIRGEPLPIKRSASTANLPPLQAAPLPQVAAADHSAFAGLYGAPQQLPLLPPQPTFHVPPSIPVGHQQQNQFGYGDAMAGYYFGMYGGGDGAGASSSHEVQAQFPAFDPYAAYK